MKVAGEPLHKVEGEASKLTDKVPLFAVSITSSLAEQPPAALNVHLRVAVALLKVTLLTGLCGLAMTAEPVITVHVPDWPEVKAGAVIVKL